MMMQQCHKENWNQRKHDWNQLKNFLKFSLLLTVTNEFMFESVRIGLNWFELVWIPFSTTLNLLKRSEAVWSILKRETERNSEK